MTSHPIRRAGVLLASAALLASMAAATVAAPVWAKAECAGTPATIVGTAKGEVIKGTAKADVIVARGGNDLVLGLGGNDIICGGPGHDRIFGNGGADRVYGATGRDRLNGGLGPDRLFGGAGPDAIDGGFGRDLCGQGPGSGPLVRCELPRITPVAPVVPAPLPPPKTLAIAYSDRDGSRTFGTGDVLISKVIDSDRSGTPSAGDTIVMDRYPVDQQATAFAYWGVDRHTVAVIETADATELHLTTTTDGIHIWVDEADEQSYFEYMPGGGGATYFYDMLSGTDEDELNTWLSSPSQPGDHADSELDIRDNRFIDVELLY